MSVGNSVVVSIQRHERFARFLDRRAQVEVPYNTYSWPPRCGRVTSTRKVINKFRSSPSIHSALDSKLRVHELIEQLVHRCSSLPNSRISTHNANSKLHV